MQYIQGGKHIIRYYLLSYTINTGSTTNSNIIGFVIYNTYRVAKTWYDNILYHI